MFEIGGCSLDVQAFYDALSYENDPDYLVRSVTRNLSAEEVAGRAVLDYGCGAGDASCFMARHLRPASVTGLDIGTRNLNQARQKCGSLPGVMFLQVDLNHFEPEPEAYDIVWADTVIELLTMDLSRQVDLWYRSLRSGGLLYVSFNQRTVGNRLLFHGLVPLLRMLSRMGLRIPLMWTLKQVVLLRQGKSVIAKGEADLENKIGYLFLPFIRLIREQELAVLLTRAGFLVEYIRPRLKSDPDSTPHLEIRARKAAT
ncbi:MAG: class I SAM-dependent methyltransferase [Magnetococcales bacterium]|nr:class I SAM-dependent methyltransferase [Magnetococcales bacterium]